MTYKVYGSTSKGKHPSESVEMSTFFNRIRAQYPHTWGRLAIHVRNEGKRTQGQVQFIRAEGGFIKGAPDIIIPGSPSFVCEMKSRSKASKLSPEQVEYLTAAHNAGAFVCVAFGVDAAWEALQDWIRSRDAT